MTLLEALAVLAAGAVAGGVNAVVGSGSLITFPTLLAVGYPPVTANVSNSIGLVPGGVSGSLGYRAELRGQGRRTGDPRDRHRLSARVIGGVLLLQLPDDVFDAVVPILILLAVGLMALRPSAKLRERGDNMPGGIVSSFFVGIYGGYFGAAQGIILMSLLRRCFHENLQVLNAIKNVLAAIANLVAGVLFMLVAHVAWGAAALIAVGSTVGAQVGAHYGRRLPQEVLRWIVIVYGTIVAIILILT